MIDYGETPHPYYITRFYERGTLADLYQEGFGEEMFPRILLQLLLGVRDFHRLGLAHRDIKEENIFVDDDLNLILGDPDFLKSEKDNVLKTFCGTYLYAAPEILTRRKRYNKSVDVWSLAICILNIFYPLKLPDDGFPHTLDIYKQKAWSRNWCKAIFKQLRNLDEDNDQIIDILKPMLEYDPARRSTVDQCLKRGCENGLLRENRFGDIVLATEVNTEVNTPASFSSFKFDLDDGEKTPKTRSLLSGCMADVLLPSTIRLEEIPADTEDRATPQSSFPSFPELPETALGDELPALEVPLSFLGEIHENTIPTAKLLDRILGTAQDGATPQPTFASASISDIRASVNTLSFCVEACDRPIPTIEFSEENPGCGEGERVPTNGSPSISEGDCSGPPARRLEFSLPNASEWSATIGLELSPSKDGYPLDDQSTDDDDDDRDDLSKLCIKKDSFSSDLRSSFSSRELGSSANPDVLAC